MPFVWPPAPTLAFIIAITVAMIAVLIWASRMDRKQPRPGPVVTRTLNAARILAGPHDKVTGLEYLDKVDPDEAAMARWRYGCLTPWQDDPARYGRAVKASELPKHVVEAFIGAEDRRFRDLTDLLRPGDLLVFNDTRVIPARLFGTKDSGGRVEILLERLVGGHEVLAQVGASKSPKPGGRITLDGEALAVGGDGAFGMAGGLERVALAEPDAAVVGILGQDAFVEVDRGQVVADATQHHGLEVAGAGIARLVGQQAFDLREGLFLARPGIFPVSNEGLHMVYDFRT